MSDYISFNNFVAKKHEKVSSLLKGKSHTLEEYKQKILAQSGCFTEWLNANDGLTLTVDNAHDLIGTYMQHTSGFSTLDAPRVIVLIERGYNIKFPQESGILTPEYWEPIFEKVA